MSKVAVIGSRDSILGFKGLGISIFSVKKGEEASRTLATIANNDYAAIFITEDFAEGVEEILKDLRERPLPTVTFIPAGAKGTRGLGMERLRNSVRKAVGADIL